MWFTLNFFPNFSASKNLVPRVFGSVAFVHVHSQNRRKLDPRALRCVFVENSSTQKWYKCFHPPTKKYFVSADVTFVETKSFFQHSYPQGETLSKDRTKDLFFLDFPRQQSFLDFSCQHISIGNVQHISAGDCLFPTSVESTPVSVEPEPIHFESTPLIESPRSSGMMKDTRKQDNTKPLQVYSRKKIPSS